jgi:AcrR family transcriptional regulator
VSSHAPIDRRYRGKTAGERRAQRREKLLEAAAELFGTIGFAATTIEMLCHQARLHPRYFYEQFATREELLAAVYDRHVETVLKTVLAALERAPADPRGRLEAGLRAFVDAALEDQRLARINYFEMHGVNRELEAHRRSVLRTYAELIAAQIDALEPDRRPGLTYPRLGAVAIVGAVDGLIVDALALDPPTDREQLITTVLDLVTPSEGGYSDGSL